MYKSKIKTLALSISVTVFATSLILMPGESLEASIRGLDMWWEIVFPSLLPFFIVSEMLIGFGVVRFIGVMLEPLMRPLFRVPGVGGFVWAMGMASGFPAGAKLTARLRQEEQITKLEAERLVSFTNSSNPLFIFGAVSVGFFQNATLGIVLAAAHYIGNICVGVVMRFYGGKENEESRKNVATSGKNGFILKEAFTALHETRLQDKRPIGKLLGDAVTSSIQTLLMIGGFIILFSVINKMLYHLNITTFFAEGLSALFLLLQLPDQLSIPFISGMFEITLGSKLTSGVTEATLLHQAIITSFILGFSGFSVQAQVASILAETDIRFKPFFYARLVHGLAASVTTIIIWKPIYKRFSDEQLSNAIPVFARHNDAFWTDMLFWFKTAGPVITISSLVVYMILYTMRTRA
ncbi:sporulation integral membrane protein YlbJ [Bacillus sp. AFS015802]|uniref:sporulation integral membrane protein YlbJ n=1 Tax=Bacillus sp. AFS015802 TaxID=2033486 RepID=UPI000BFA1CA2|nr:sporulation integral membrane protein YlbJ [Bacillus sp. AFS015802]PFA68935.1 sporulation integral membrane protein YlbJ [Bacillus sp. AFS015802]